MDDIFPLKKYLDDPAVTDMFVIGTGEIIVKKFAAGKLFTGEFLSPSKVRGIILSATALLDKQIDPVNGLPKLEAVIPPPYNTRITGLLPPWVASPEVTQDPYGSLRKPPRIIFPKEPYRFQRTMWRRSGFPLTATTWCAGLSKNGKTCS
jgi:Flp pilus assembly CpaF family ATPase